MLTFAHGPDGNALSVEKLARLPKPARPAATCPACGGHLIAHLGPTVAHHFKHAPNSLCYAATPEGALHLDAKLRLAAHLRVAVSEGRSLTITEACAACERPARRQLATFQDGDSVEMERQLERLRPDVMVTRGRQAIAAFEIVVSHACDDEKWATLRRLAVPTVESAAESIIAWDQSGGFVRADPPFDHVEPQQEEPECDSCRSTRIEAFNTPTPIPFAVCAVNRFFGNGHRDRHCLAVWRVRLRGVWSSARLVLGRESVLYEWDAQIAQDRDKLLADARQAASSWNSSLPAAVCVDTHGRFHVVPSHADREDLDRWMNPYPNFWWDQARREWIRAYHPAVVDEKLSFMNRGTRIRWSQEGRIPKVRVQAHAGAKIVTLSCAESIDKLVVWHNRKELARKAEVRRLFRAASTQTKT